MASLGNAASASAHIGAVLGTEAELVQCTQIGAISSVLRYCATASSDLCLRSKDVDEDYGIHIASKKKKNRQGLQILHHQGAALAHRRGGKQSQTPPKMKTRRQRAAAEAARPPPWKRSLCASNCWRDPPEHRAPPPHTTSTSLRMLCVKARHCRRLRHQMGEKPTRPPSTDDRSRRTIQSTLKKLDESAAAAWGTPL